MSPSWADGGDLVLDGWELFGQPGRRAHPRQLAELACEVGLVVIAAGGRHRREAGPERARQQATGPIEAHDAPGDLGRQAELALELLGQVTAAPPDVPGEGAHLDVPA